MPKWYPNDEDPQLGIFIQQQAEALSSHEQVVVIYVQKKKALKDRFQIFKQEWDNLLEITVQFRAGSNRLTNLWRYCKAQQKAYLELTGGPKICHVHVPMRSAFLALKLKLKSNVPFVISEHWSGWISGAIEQKGKLYRKIYSVIAQQSKQYIVPSETLKTAFEKHQMPDSIVVPNIIELPKDLTTEKEPIILTVGDFVDSTKNITGLITAFTRWKKQKNSPFQLHIVGDGADRDLIQERIAGSSVQEAIVWHGRLTQQDVIKQMQKASIYVCNSNFETFGVTVGEAIASGTPVICTKCEGPEMMINENTGIFIDKNNTGQLVDALEWMQQYHTTFSPEKMRNFIEMRFSAPRVVDALRRLYNSDNKN